MRLNDININYLIVSAYVTGEDRLVNIRKMNKLENSLYVKEYTVMPLGSDKSPAFLAYKECSNNELRYDSIELMDEFEQSHVIVKYRGEEEAKKIMFNGSEKLLGIIDYTGDSNNDNFFIEGYSFSFKPQRRYWIPTKESDFVDGMLIEYKNNSNQWAELTVINSKMEYEQMYKLLLKYKRIRIPYIDE